MKNLKRVTVLAAMSVVLFSCKKEVTQPQEKEALTEVTHRYIYNNQESTVIYSFNENNEVVSRKGDTEEYARMINTRSKSVGDMAILVEEVNEAGTNFTMRFFDSGADMDVHHKKMNLGRTSKEANPEEKGNPCYNNEWAGSASFHFYKHVDYGEEMMNLRRVNRAFFQIHYLDSYYENDQISSLQVINGSVDLFRDGCFYGTQIRFLHNIPNLHFFSAAMVYPNNPNDPVDYIGSRPNGFFPGNCNFGDVASSIKGWSL